MEEEKMQVAMKKYKICEVTPQDNKDSFKVFAETIDKIKEWALSNYKKDNLPKIKYVYSVATVEEAKKYGKQI